MMDLSKLNISSIAKEEIRRKFFDSRSLTTKKSEDTENTDQKPLEDLETVDQEKTNVANQPTVPPLDVGTSISEDDSLPLITSVFSLALSSSGTEDGGCASMEGIGVSPVEKVNTTTKGVMSYPTVRSSNDARVCIEDPLPFVVKCSPNGVIAVCSPPNPTSMSSDFRQDHEDSTTITSCVKGSVCSTDTSDKTPTSTGQQVVQGTTTSSILSPCSDSNTRLITFIDATKSTIVPVEKPRFEMEKYLPTGTCEMLKKSNTICSSSESKIPNQVNHSVIRKKINEHSLMHETRVETPTTISRVTTCGLRKNVIQGKDGETNENNPSDEADLLNKTPTKPTNLSTSQKSLSDGKNSETPAKELAINDECIALQVPTKHDEKIRQLKDLLRQKEAELEKFRFKTEGGPLSAAAKLRENFLKKNPSLRRRSKRTNLNKETESTDQFSAALSSSKDMELDKKDKMDLSCKETRLSGGSETESSSESELCVSEREKTEKAKVDVKTLSNSAKQRDNTKFNNQDKYKLVNVTILQGHTRTLAVPVEKDKAASESFANQTTETTTRKRKQNMPKKTRTVQSKRNSTVEEDITSLKSYSDCTETDSSEHVTRHCPKDTSHTLPYRRTSPRKRQEDRSPHHNSLKRKHSSIMKEKTKDKPGVPKKLTRVSSSPKAIKEISMPVTSTVPLRQLRASKSGQASKTDSTAIKDNSSSKLATGTKTLTVDKSTSQQTAALVCSTAITSQSSPSLTSSTVSAAQLSGLAANTTRYVLHMSKAGATAEPKKKSEPSDVSDKELAKSIVDNSKKQVFALVGKMPVSPITNPSKGVSDKVKTSLAEAKVIPQSNREAVFNERSEESEIFNPTSAANTSVSLTKKTVLSASTNETPIPIFSNPMMNIQQTKLRNELSKLGLLTNTSTTNIGCHPEVVGPFVVNPVNYQTASTTKSPLTLLVTQNHQQNTVPILANSTRRPVRNTSSESWKNVNTPLLTDNTSQSSSVATPPNRQARAKNSIGSSLTNITGVVNTVASLIINKSTITTTRPLAPKPTLQLNAVTFPVPKEKSIPKTKSVLASMSKSVASTNLTSSSSSKIANAVPQYKLHRPLAPKPTLTQNTSLSPILPKTGGGLYTACRPTSRKSPILQSTTAVPLSHKSSTPLLTSPQPITAKPLSSQSITSNPTASEQSNKVVVALPKPVMTVSTTGSPTLPKNLNNGNILVYDVVQSNPPTAGQPPPVGVNNAAKLVMYVSNTGETRNLGIIKDNKIYLNSNQVSVVANKQEVKSPVTTSASEFIPNSGDAEFKTLLGLEHVVHLLT